LRAEEEIVGALDGQVALVTGCGRRRGLGQAIALGLAAAGADVCVTDVAFAGRRNVDEPDDPAEASWDGLVTLVAELESLGRRAVALVGDVGMQDAAERMVAEAIAAMGQLDILVNNAGAPHGLDRNWSWLVPEDSFDEVFRVNTKGVFLMSGAVIRHLLERGAPGRIVNIASGAGRRGFPQRAAYCGSKFAVIGLTQAMALEVAGNGITVNAVCPGAIDTARQSARSARSSSAEPGSQTAAPPASPVPRLGTADDITRTVCFLVDPAAGYVTGQALNVDGGLIMG
jgi:NAD(P)-dependent dehydrogenase (short-subunit alcohol dehydrogenase family)